jgi:ubiquinone/menaquinone biosynthesis C-methylase UbiE
MMKTPSTDSQRRAIAACALLLLAGCATWKKCAYEGWGRDESQQPERVVTTLGIGPGDRVADLGSGSGYFTFRLADAVGKDGKVYAVDIDPDMTEMVAAMARERGAANVEVVLAEPEDPELPDGEIDLVFTANTYHHIADRVDYFTRLKRDLSPKGRVAILDYHEGGGWFATWFGHSTPTATVTSEMEQAGYRISAAPDFLTEQTFLIFAPEEAAKPPS